MAARHIVKGVEYFELTMEELEHEIVYMSQNNVANARRILESMRTAILDDSEQRRWQAQQQLEQECRGRCHGVVGRGNKVPMPREEQRKLGHIVLIGSALVAGSGGAGALMATGRAIRFGWATERAIRTTTTAAQTIWVLTSDMMTKAVIACSPVSLNPRLQQSILDFSVSLFPGPPVPSVAGFAGSVIGDEIQPENILR